jgi:FkbM family methyltransferase
VIEKLSELLELIKNVNSIVLYGAGNVGKAMVIWMDVNKSLDKISFIVDTKKRGRLYGFPIISLSELNYEPSQRIIVTSTSSNRNEIIAEISKYHYMDMVLLSDTLCKELIDERTFLRGGAIATDKKYWNNQKEKTFLRENGWDVFFDDISIKYINLVRGMDIESTDTIARIICRIKRILSEEKDTLDIYTEYEQIELKKQKTDFYDLIWKCSEDKFCYRKYMLPINHFESSVFYYKHGIDHIADIAALSGKTFIDAGGYIGDSVLVMEELFPETIIVFEALPKHCKLIKKTVEMNSLRNVVVENMALGEEAGSVEIQVADSGSNGIGRKGLDYSEKVITPVISLDDYVEKNNILNIGLIKSDIEGMEPYLLKGAKKSIEKYKPVLLICIYHNPYDFFEIKPMIESWNLGYKFSVYKPVTGGVVGETVLIAQV